MDKEQLEGVLFVLLGWVLFGGTHALLLLPSIRRWIESKIGPQPFRGIYSLIALVTFGFFFHWIALYHGSGEPLYPSLAGFDWARWVTLGFVAVGFAFLTGTSVKKRDGSFRAAGFHRITRHPHTIGWALFAIGHLLIRSFPSDAIAYLGFPLYATYAAFRQQRSALREHGDAYRKYMEETSFVPFAAILSGKQKLRLGEIKIVRVIVFEVIVVLFFIFHAQILRFAGGS